MSQMRSGVTKRGAWALLRVGLLLALLAGMAISPPCVSQPRSHLTQQALDRIAAVPYQGSITLVVMGDTRDNDEVFSFLLRMADRLRPSFIIDLGDFVSSGLEQEYDHFLGVIKGTKAPVLTALGNHEVINGGRQFYRALFGPEQYSFDYGNCRFIVVDNSDGELSAGELRWLEGRLQTNRRKFVFAHEPPATMRWWHNFRQGAPEFMALMQRHKVDRVFLGHLHGYDRQVIDGVTYIVTGGGGAPLQLLYGGIRHHFVIVQVDGDRITDLTVALEGQ